MYANLRVTTPKDKVLSAWQVTVERDKVCVHLDRQDGTGSYAEPGGVLVLHPGAGTIKVEADF